MPILNISLFGRFSIHLDSLPLIGFDLYKVQELLSYLLLYRDRPHPRETLAGTLWGDSSTSQSKKYLRQTVWQLQSALNSDVIQNGHTLLIVEPDWIRLNSELNVFFDVAEFEKAFALVQGVPGKALDSDRINILQVAVRLYEGDLLEGWYQDWCIYERERLQNLYLSMLDKLMEYCEANDHYEAGLMYGADILRIDRARERTHRQLMRLEYLAGNRTSALRQYERCVAALKEELGVSPEKRTTALYEEIRNDQIAPPDPTKPLDDLITDKAPASLPELLNRLINLKNALTDIQRQVQQDISAVELVLKENR